MSGASRPSSTISKSLRFDEAKFYIADTRQKPSHLRVFDVKGAGLTGGAIFGTCDSGGFDGVRVDAKGNVWSAAHDGLHCFAPDGTLIGKLRMPKICSNFTFGGARRNELFITASSSLYTLRVNIDGARYP